MSALFRTLAAAPLALAIALVTASPAHASAIYTYTGNNFNLVSSAGPTPPADTYTSADRVTIVMELAAPLAANLAALTTVAPLSFTFTDGVNTITNANAPDSIFQVATDASGSISSWLVAGSIFAPKDGGGTYKSIATYNAGPTVLDEGLDVLCGTDSSVGVCFLSGEPFYEQSGRIRNRPGVWALQTTVPEPTSMLLVGAALAGFAARRRATRAR